MINLLKVLPIYSMDSARDNRFWEQFSAHLDFRDLYPAGKIAAHLQAAMDGADRDRLVDLAQYVLMFFDPEDRPALEILAGRGRVGPGVIVARLWCREVTEAAWIIHRAVLTSYPQQVGQLYSEANESTNPSRRAELGLSVYDTVRAQALVRMPVADQIAALREDPSSEVRYAVAKSGGYEVQMAALEVPTAWDGLANNEDLEPSVLERLTNVVLARLDHPDDDSLAHRALFDLCERNDLTRPLAEKISAAIDGDREYDGSWIAASVLAIRRALSSIDATTSGIEHDRPRLRPAPELTKRPSWWRRFLDDHDQQ
ncbi:MAG: hypothetical protein ACRDRH_10390 [Pseudonocardia sp.]